MRYDLSDVASLPIVECLCPTYGRHEQLMDAVACYVLQTWPRRRLYICNDSGWSTPGIVLQFEGSYVDGIMVAYPELNAIVHNAQRRAPSLGAKRQWLLETAHAPFVAHWDDDDLYLPWHLESLMQAQAESRAECIKPKAAWWIKGHRDKLNVAPRPHHNVFEGQMLFEREAAVAREGYADKATGQCRRLIERFRKACKLREWNPDDLDVSYCYRWADGTCHISAIQKQELTHQQFARRNRDFGDGTPIVPTGGATAWARERLQPQFAQLVDQLRAKRDDYLADELATRLRTVRPSLAPIDLDVPTSDEQPV